MMLEVVGCGTEAGSTGGLVDVTGLFMEVSGGGLLLLWLKGMPFPLRYCWKWVMVQFLMSGSDANEAAVC